MKGILATGLLLLAGAVSAQATNAFVSIRSRPALVSYLGHLQPGQSPLDALSPGARKRFIASLRFGPNGVSSFDARDLAGELNRSQIRGVLALFGVEAELSAVQPNDKPLRGGQKETPLERQYDEFYIKQQTHPIGASLCASYDALIASFQQPERLAHASTHDVDLLFRAATSVAWVAPCERYLRDARMDLDELAQRGFADSQRVSTMHDLLVSARDFDAANSLALRFPAADIRPLSALRKIVSATPGAPTVLLARSGQPIIHEAIQMDVPLRIIVIAGCHFSEDAVRAISRNPEMGRLFHAHAIWLSSETERLPDVAEWNREFPDQPMYVAWRDDEWKMLGNWSMPTFYVFEHGKLVDRWSGWASDKESLKTLRMHLKDDGVLPR